MIGYLIKHEWLNFIRSASFQRSAVTTLATGFFMIIIAVYLFLLSFAIEPIVRAVSGSDDVVGVMNRILIYYFLFEFISRYFFQKVVVGDLNAYLRLPISKNNIVHYLLGKSFLSLFNMFIIVLFTPFALNAVAGDTSTLNAISWLLTLIFLGWTFHFITLQIKRKYSDSIWVLVLILFTTFLFLGSDYFGWLTIGKWTAPLFEAAISTPFPLLVSAFLLIVAYVVSFRSYRDGCYLDELAAHKSEKVSGQDFAFLEQFGKVGSLINIEARMAFRHKRTRNTFLICAFFLLYGLFFYPGMDEIGMVLKIFIGIFITGIFIMQYGQFLYSWNSGYFDFYQTEAVSIKDYIGSKYYFLAGVSFICFILSVPYVYFGWNIVLINGALFLYNIGVNAFLVMNMAMWSPQKLDLGKSAAFSWDGVGAAQWIMGIPLLFGPWIIYAPFGLLGFPYVGITVLGIIGLTGIAFRNQLIQFTTNRFEKRRYSIGASFRGE